MDVAEQIKDRITAERAKARILNTADTIWLTRTKVEDEFDALDWDTIARVSAEKKQVLELLKQAAIITQNMNKREE